MIKRVLIPPLVAEYGTTVGIVAFALCCLAIALPVSWLSWTLFEVRLAGVMRRAFTVRRDLGETVRAT